MYYDFAVKIPAEKAKIFTKDKGGASYVLFQYGTEYKADRKYAVPKRAIIGKIDPSDEYSVYKVHTFR